MLHVTVVEGEGLTPGVDYVRRTDERIRIGIANDTDKSSIILDFTSEGEIKIKYTENYSEPKFRLQTLFEGKIEDFVTDVVRLSDKM